VVLANGRTICMGPDFDEQALVRLVRVLEAACRRCLQQYVSQGCFTS
jgi:hypothetical protein